MNGSPLLSVNVFMYVLYVCVSVFQKYKSYSPYDMQESIRKEVKGDLEKSFLTLGMPTSPTTPAKTCSGISQWIRIGLFAAGFVFVLMC